MVQVDRYVSSILTLLKRRFAEWDAKPPTAADMRRPFEPRPLRRVGGPNGLQVAVEDEDWPERTFAERAMHALFSSPFYPLWDDPQTWASPAEAEAEVRALFGARAIVDEVTSWGELESDAAQSTLAFRGLGAIWLRHGPDPKEPFVVDLGWLADCEVREGFERYGTAAFFDAERRIVRIRWAHGEKDVRPGDPDWAHAKYAWRSSIGVGVTVADHLWCVHFRLANEVVLASRELLPAEHPLRLLLKPYGYRTIAINHAASTLLLVKRGLPHRAFAFTAEGLATAALHGEHRFRLEPFRQFLTRQGTVDLRDFPLAEDGLALEAVIREFVSKYLALYYPTHHSVIDDAAVQAWWARLEPVRPDTRSLATRDQLVDVVTGLVFAVTGLHKLLGAMREYTLDPTKMGARIRPGATMGDVQGTLMAMLMTAATGLPQPRLLSDFSHLLPGQRGDEARAVLAAFADHLRDLSIAIDRKNLDRPLPYDYFNPAHLDCSVSI